MLLPWLFGRYTVRRISNAKRRVLLLTAAVAFAVSLFLAVTYASQASISEFGKLERETPLLLEAKFGLIKGESIRRISRALSTLFDLSPRLDVAVTFDQKGRRYSTSVVGLEIPSSTTNGVVISEALSNRLELAKGGVLNALVNDEVFRLLVEGVVPNEEFPLSTEQLITSLATAQQLSKNFDELSTVGLTPRATLPEGYDALKAYVDNEAPDLFLFSREDRRERARRVTKAFRTNITAMVVVSLFVSVLTILSASNLALLRVREDVKLLHILGCRRGQCIRLLLLDAIVIGALGGVVGVTLGKPLADLIARSYLGTVKGLYLPSANLFETIPIVGNFSTYILAFFVGILITCLGFLWPILQVTRVRSSRVGEGELIRPVSYKFSVVLLAMVTITPLLIYFGVSTRAISPIYLSIFTGLTALVLFLRVILQYLIAPVLRPMALRFGVPGFVCAGELRAGVLSSALSFGVVACGIALLVGIGVLTDSFRGTLKRWVSYQFSADLFVKPVSLGVTSVTPTIHKDLVDKISQLPGIRFVAPATTVRTVAFGEDLIIAGGDMTISKATGSVSLLEGQFPSRDGEALVSESAMLKLQVKSGMSIIVRDEKLSVTGVYKDFSRETPTILLPIKGFQARFPGQGVESLSIYLHPGISSEMVRRDVAKLTRHNPLQISTNIELRNAIGQIFDRTFSITFIIQLIVGAIASIGVVISLLQQLTERQEKIRALFIQGVRPAEYRTALLLESILLSVPSILFGLAGGVVVAMILVYVVNPLSFGWSLDLMVTPSALLKPAVVLFSATTAGALFAGLLVRAKIVNVSKQGD